MHEFGAMLRHEDPEGRTYDDPGWDGPSLFDTVVLGTAWLRIAMMTIIKRMKESQGRRLNRKMFNSSDGPGVGQI